MHREGSSIPGKATVILPILSLFALALSVAFARSLPSEPPGLLGFGLFCLGFAAFIRSVSRPQQDRRTNISNTSPSDSHQSTATAKHWIDPVREATDQVAG